MLFNPGALHRNQPANALAEAGLTLVELAITLVIISLFVGVIIVGQSLIREAQIRAFLSQIDQYNKAFTSFETKYGCVAGDCRKLSSFFPTLPNGDGDGYIDSCWPDGYPPPCDYIGGYDYTKELASAWAALSLGGFIPENYNATSTTPGIGFPLVAGEKDNGIMVGAWNRKHYFRTGMAGVWGAGVMPISYYGAESPISYYGAPSFTPADALSIDSKIDDGNPLTGNVTWAGFCAYNCFEFDGTGGYYDTSNWNSLSEGALGANNPVCYAATGQFNVAYSGRTCNAVIAAKF